MTTRKVTLVWGPPCGGKSTFVQEHAQRGDIVLDRDSIYQALSISQRYENHPELADLVSQTWDQLLRSIPDQASDTWIISSSPQRSQRQELEHLTTEAQFVFADMATCTQRAKQARPETWNDHISNWFANFEPDNSDRSLDMNLERRTAAEGVELREDGDTLTAVGYAAVFESTSQNLGGFVERVAPGAFRKTLQEADVRALFNHEPDHLLGRSTNGTLRMMEDDRGLRYEIDLPNTQLGKDVAELLRRGDLNSSSFGFRTISDNWTETADGYPMRRLTEVALRDVGPVSFPAYLGATSALRSLAEQRNLNVDDLVQAAEADELQTFLREEPETDIEPSSPHSVAIPASSFIR
jgi:HK97 family phage prohead protease